MSSAWYAWPLDEGWHLCMGHHTTQSGKRNRKNKTNMRRRTGASEKSVESVLTPEKTQSPWREGARKKTGFGPVSVELIVSCRIYNTGRWMLPSGRWPNWSSHQTSCPSSYNTRNVSRSFFVKYVSAPPTNQIINQSWIFRVGPNNTGISRH